MYSPTQKDPISFNTNRLQFFSSLFDTNDMVYLDPNRNYCIIKSTTYTSMRDELEKSHNNQQLLQKKLFQTQLQNNALNREMNKYKQELDKIAANQKILAQQYDKIARRCREYQRTETQLRQIIKQKQNTYLQIPTNQRKISMRNYTIASTQTELIIQQQEEPIQQVPSEEEAPPMQVEAAEQRLYELLENEMEKFQQQFESKVSALEEQRLSIQRWSEENRQLKEENEQLRQKVVERNIEEEKLEAWRQTVSGFVARVQSRMVEGHKENEQEQGGEGEVGRLRAEVVDLRGRMVEMRNKMRRIDEMMEGEGEVSDDGAIGVLVRLSQKVKAIVKGMVLEVEQI